HPEDAEQFFVVAERDTHKTAAAAEVDGGTGASASSINRIFGQIVRSDNRRALNDLVGKATGHQSARFAVELGKRRWRAPQRNRVEDLAIIGVEDAKRGSAQPESLLQHRIEHGSEIARRAVDD